MALIKCKECGKEHSRKASACPNCGQPAPKKTRPVTWFIFVGIVVIAINAIWFSDSDSSTPGRPKPNEQTETQTPAPLKLVNVRITNGTLTLTIKNLDTPNWNEMTIYLNGGPSIFGTFQATFEAPGIGETAIVALSDFTKGTKRFDPRTQAVKSLMIGGGGYDFDTYQFL